MNWSRQKKWACTFVLGFMTFCVTFASSVFSAATLPAARHFHTTVEVMVLGTAIFVLGFAFGFVSCPLSFSLESLLTKSLSPIVWGPLSELYGRKLPLFVGILVFGIFQVPAAVATNLATLITCRFLAGVFGSAPLTIVGGALADFWNPVDRGIAVAIFSGATFLGPTMGPIIGGFLTENESLGWRWTSWITLILTGFWGLVGFFVYPESFAPVLLARRAKQRRAETGNQAIHALHEEIGIDLRQIGERYLSKPLVMLIKEPILLLITVYMSFIYVRFHSLVKTCSNVKRVSCTCSSKPTPSLSRRNEAGPSVLGLFPLLLSCVESSVVRLLSISLQKLVWLGCSRRPVVLNLKSVSFQ